MDLTTQYLEKKSSSASSVQNIRTIDARGFLYATSPEARAPRGFGTTIAKIQLLPRLSIVWGAQESGTATSAPVAASMSTGPTNPNRKDLPNEKIRSRSMRRPAAARP